MQSAQRVSACHSRMKAQIRESTHTYHDERKLPPRGDLSFTSRNFRSPPHHLDHVCKLQGAPCKQEAPKVASGLTKEASMPSQLAETMSANEL